MNDTAALDGGTCVNLASHRPWMRPAWPATSCFWGVTFRQLPTGCDTARKAATSRIRENFRIATVYNVIAVPLAVIGLATPLIAALAMSTSSITVSLNALRLR